MNFAENGVNLKKTKMIVEVTNKLIIDYKAREWCKISYPLHPNGCPNYNHKETCPPKVELIENWCNLAHKAYFVVVSFDLQAHVNKMLSLYPNWSDRQAKCVLYWQPKVKKQLEDETKLFCAFKNVKYTYCPEAMGVNIIKTLKRLDFPISTHPREIVYKVSLVTEI